MQVSKRKKMQMSFHTSKELLKLRTARVTPGTLLDCFHTSKELLKRKVPSTRRMRQVRFHTSKELLKLVVTFESDRDGTCFHTSKELLKLEPFIQEILSYL